MIRNWEYHGLNMDFSNCDVGYGAPSDIDMFYEGRNGFLVIGEIKNEQGQFGYGQRRRLARVIDNHRTGGMILYIVHDKFVQNGDTTVDIAKCMVKEYYYKHDWHEPILPTTVREFMERQFGRDKAEELALREFLQNWRKEHKLEEELCLAKSDNRNTHISTNS